jgi:hypothetical protein
MELDECKKKFSEFYATMNTVVTADVRENIGSID